MHLYRIARLLLLLAAPVAQSTAQTAAAPGTQRSLIAGLAGATAKNWIKEREAVFMGGNRCQTGERWRFAATGELKVRRCLAGRWSVSVHHWKIEDQGGKPTLRVEPALAENGRRVLLSDDGSRLTLRKIAGTKTAGIDDIQLGLTSAAPTNF